MVKSHHYALIVFDRMGCGREAMNRRDIEKVVENNLVSGGWDNRAAAVVIDPELEVWVWSNSPEVANTLGWPSDMPDLKDWLKTKGYWTDNSIKPSDPKLAFEQVLYQTRKPRSSAIYEQLGRRVSFQRCTDPAFGKFKRTLQRWFGR
ncbi:hypothetical protein hamaS1_10160 [Moorella sp. Hama-1]|nr:hypothetical protein hamaS1_10160 [Moorella sp. Hama-1]